VSDDPTRTPHGLYDPAEVFTPARLNRLARGLIEDMFPLVWIEGELSNFARPASGHWYFTLKDEAAQVRCAMFRPRAMLVRARPADGMRVLMRARVSLYEGRGEFQLVVEHLEPAGEGALRRAYEALKQKLLLEGLFAPERRKPLPALPARIAVITSPTGAAIRDVLAVLARRFPLVEVEVLPVPVQGGEASARVARMLASADRSGRYDVLLLTRGGGSLEDLQAFNDEALARAIAAARTPVVSAIGHEVDEALSDLVADLRAPTPSAAAERLVPDQHAVRARLDALLRRVHRHQQNRTRELGQRLDQLAQRLRSHAPARRLQDLATRLGSLAGRLSRARATPIAARRVVLAQLAHRLRLSHPGHAVARHRRALDTLRARESTAWHGTQQRRRTRLDGLARALHAVSPLDTLRRGYAVLRDPQGTVVRSVMGIAPGTRLVALLADGELSVTVDRVPISSQDNAGNI